MRQIKILYDTLFIIYLLLKRNSIFKRNYAVTFDVSCGMFSNVISLIYMGVSTNMDLFEIGIIPSFIEESFPNLIW